MILAHLTAVNLFNCILWQWVIFEVVYRFASDLAAIDKEATFGPFEENAVIPFARNDQFNCLGIATWILKWVAALY